MNNNTIHYLTSKDFLNAKIVYGFFTRNGGKSKKPFDSLNCNFSSEDNKKHIKENIKAAKQKIGLEKTKIKFVSQIHGTNIKLINNKNISKKIIADGSITQTKNISLAILTADCAPIFFVDINNNIICAIHSGWRGCLNNIVLKTLNKIKKINNSIKNIVAIIGPCLDQSNFRVDENFKKKFTSMNSKYKIYFMESSKNNIFFNMRGLIEHQLRDLSVNHIFHVNNDTYSDSDLFFSHRRSTQKGTLSTGRMINIIGFKQ